MSERCYHLVPHLPAGCIYSFTVCCLAGGRVFCVLPSRCLGELFSRCSVLCLEFQRRGCGWFLTTLPSRFAFRSRNVGGSKEFVAPAGKSAHKPGVCRDLESNITSVVFFFITLPGTDSWPSLKSMLWRHWGRAACRRGSQPFCLFQSAARKAGVVKYFFSGLHRHGRSGDSCLVSQDRPVTWRYQRRSGTWSWSATVCQYWH